MKFVKSSIYYAAVLLLIISLMTQEVDARRKILRGRKTVTRTYYKSAAIPAWAIILLVALGEIILGAVTYVVMKKTIIDPPIGGTYSLPGAAHAP